MPKWAQLKKYLHLPNNQMTIMKKYLFSLFLVISLAWASQAQTINNAYVKALYKKYPTQPTNFCTSCKLWVNPYYKSIADTLQHRPLLTFYIYTKAHRLQQEAAKVPRKGIYAAWQAADGQPKETQAYTNANKIVNQRNQNGEIQKGHCQAWILLAYTADGAILSDTYTFNAAMEFRGQNLGTEIESEELCRNLTGYRNHPETTDSVRIWCGTYGSQRVFTSGNLQHTVPAFYYKVIAYDDKIQHRQVEVCYWMPNLPEESRQMLNSRKKTYPELCALLGFSPKDVFK